MIRLSNPYLIAFRNASEDPEANEIFGPMLLAISDQEAGDFATHMIEWAVRDRLIHEYSYAIPDKKAILLLAEHGPIVEIGAGTGYWAWLLRQVGADVIAVDTNIEGQTRLWTEVIHADETMAAHHPDRTLLLVWPPHEVPMASRAVNLHRKAGGRRVIYVGERTGGCTGDEALFGEFRRHYEVVEEHAIPRWHGMRDSLVVLERR